MYCRPYIHFHDGIISPLSFHLPERANHSPDEAPLALHIGFQIIRALSINLLDGFLLLRQNPVPAKAKASTEL